MKQDIEAYFFKSLIYDKGHLIQIIQSPIATIDNLYARISKDQRHTDIKLIGEELLHMHDCSGWGIGIYNKQEVAQVLYDVNYADAKSLLPALKNVI